MHEKNIKPGSAAWDIVCRVEHKGFFLNTWNTVEHDFSFEELVID